MEISKEHFVKEGVVVLKNILSSTQTAVMVETMNQKILACAQALNCNVSDYLRNVSRWLHPSPLTHPVYPVVEEILKPFLEAFMGETLRLSKVNIISKSAYARESIPCHQDIAYSPERPYAFSLWLALQPVGLEDGVLECLPGSHQGPIHPAVDFWKPDFFDAMYHSALWQEGSIALPVEAGDGILFDARLWHGSAPSTSSHNRFALVSRWGPLHYRPSFDIPPKVPAFFGMWTCAKQTIDLLQQGLYDFFGLTVEADLDLCLRLWADCLKMTVNFPFDIDKMQVQQALKDLWILNQASERHHGGDAQGLVYARLWHCFLKALHDGYTKGHLSRKEIIH